MTAIPQNAGATTRPVSRRLTEPLRMVAGRAKVLAFLRACFQWLVLAAAGWLVVVMVLGTARNLPVWAAILLALLAWGLVVWGAMRFFGGGRVFRRRDLSSAAHLVDVALPGTQERISSALELSQEADARFRGSPELMACLIRQAEKDADRLDPATVVSGKSVIKWFGLLMPLLALWVIVLLVNTPQVILGFQRTLRPWTSAPALPTLSLAVDPGNINVPEGDTVTINLTISPPVGSPAPTNADADTAGDSLQASIVRRFTTGSADQDLTSDMQRTGPLTFRAVIDNVAQSFTYRVSSGGVQSQTYAVTVQHRPAAANVEVGYTFPAYTHLPPRTEKSRAGAIDALVATRVSVTVDATEPLKNASLLIADNAPNPGTIPLAPVAENSQQYRGEFTLRKSTQYRIKLVNTQGLANTDNQPRPIVARPDQPPQIAIISPLATLKVRTDDNVPLHYTATDDFGITRLEALMQVDDAAGTPVNVILMPLPKMGAARPVNISEAWTLSVADVLRAAPQITHPTKISYQLRVTDNCQPGAQRGLSARQLLEIDNNVAPLAQRMDAQALRDLLTAVKKAQAEIAEAREKIEALKQPDAKKPLDEKQKQQLADARQRIAEARRELSQAAQKAADTKVGELAKKASDVAEGPLKDAEEKAADAQLASDQPAARSQSANDADKKLDHAQQQLAALQKQLGDTAREQPLTQELERNAEAQKKLADAMQQNPQDKDLLQQQKKLQKKLDDMVKKNPEWQKPTADANQGRQDALVKKIQQLEQAQTPTNDSLKNQADAPATKQKVGDLAQQQAALNRAIEQFNQQQRQELKQTSAKTPQRSQMDPIVKNLQSEKLDNAAQAQRAAGVQLDDAAQRLDAAEKLRQQQTAENPQGDRQAAHAAKNAAALQDAARKLAQDIQQAKSDHNPPTRPTDPANQQASKLAEQVKQQAARMPPSAAGKKLTQDAVRDADAARREAGKGNADAAQQHVADAAQKLAAAAQAQEKKSAAAEKPMAAAAQAAHDLAEKQRSLAQQTQAAAKSLSDAAEAKTHDADTAQQQKNLAKEIDQATKEAQSLQNNTQGGAPEMAQRAGNAAQALQQAANAQRAAAQATQQGDANDGSAKQEQTADKLATAEEALTGQPSASRQQQKPDAQQQLANGTPPPTADSDQSSEQDQAKQSPQRKQGTPPPSAKAQNPNPLKSPSEKNGQGQTAGSPQAPAAGQGQSKGQGQGQAQGGGEGTAQSGSAGGQGGQGVAQRIQAARQAQARAAQGDPAAAREAAEQLSQASQEMSGTGSEQANGQGQGQAQGHGQGQASGRQVATAGNSAGAQGQPAQGGQPSGQANGQGNAKSAGESSGQGSAGNAKGSGNGVKLTNGSTPPPPKAVQDIGLSPSDWARLPPNMQEQLLHSAQQSGPPSYHDMIKNYYSRIARLQDQEPAQ